MATEVELANCPACEHKAKEDFGMVTCVSCGQVFMIDFEGNLSVAEDHPDQPDGYEDDSTQEAELQASQVEEPSQLFSENQVPDETEYDDTEEPSEDSVVLEFPVSDPEDYSGEDEELEDYAEPEGYAPAEEPKNDIFSATSSEDSMEKETEDDGEPEPTQTMDMNAVPVEPAVVDPKDPLEISAFAASELSGLEGGLLLYDITIDGIDTPEMRDTLMFNIEDERFAWDAKAVLRTISNGCLLIENLNPLKAHVLINRLRFEGFIVTWQQKIVTDMPLPNEDEGESFAEETIYAEESIEASDEEYE